MFAEFLKKKEKKLEVFYNFTIRYINDVLTLNNSKFSDYVERSYPQNTADSILPKYFCKF